MTAAQAPGWRSHDGGLGISRLMISAISTDPTRNYLHQIRGVALRALLTVMSWVILFDLGVGRTVIAQRFLHR